MQNTVLLENEKVVNQFKDDQWIEIVGRISDLFCLSAKKSRMVMNCKTYKLIAAIPFLAGCNGALRTSLSHMAITFMAADNSAKDVFTHNFNDNSFVLKRLERISHFDGGDAEIIERGMNLLAVLMISDHIKDHEEDNSINKYNPVVSNAWNSDLEIKKLEEKIKAIDCDAMDSIMSLYDAKAGWWSGL